MRKMFPAVLLVAASFCLSPSAQADTFTRTGSDHPLRLLAYVLHPIGWAVEYSLLRPFHKFVSRDPQHLIFGHAVTCNDKFYDWKGANRIDNPGADTALFPWNDTRPQFTHHCTEAELVVTTGSVQRVHPPYPDGNFSSEREHFYQINRMGFPVSVAPAAVYPVTETYPTAAACPMTETCPVASDCASVENCPMKEIATPVAACPVADIATAAYPSCGDCPTSGSCPTK